MFSAYRLFVVLAGMLVAAAPVVAQADPPEVQKSIDVVRKYLQEKGDKGAGDVSVRSSHGIGQALPNYHVVVVRYRIYPIARLMPEGMKPSNVFAVSKEGKLDHLKDVATLEKFFRAHSPAVKSEKDATTSLSAWLVLSQEFHQDGFFKFDVLEKEFAVEGDKSKAIGRAVVMQGGNGDLKAELSFGKDGKLAKAEEKSAIRPGPRPICQATKLLDADPIVRRIVEQDLIIMGRSARDYLMEQRQIAPPALREAIDRVWAQIEKNGW